MTLEIEVQVWRGSILESRHRVEMAAVDSGGRLHAGSREPGLLTSFRSSAKPFQLLALVERGHADRWGFSDEELAVMAASHSGTEYHRRLVSGILGRIGRSEADLACGFHEPFDAEVQADLRAHPDRRSALYNNCSGKHAGMMALALAEGWPTSGYEQPDHPVQQQALRAVAECCGLAVENVVTGTDDCGVVVFGLPLTSMARGYARLASASPSGDARERALHRIRSAMTAYPAATGGPGRPSTVLMEATAGRLLAKGGAEGLECVAIADRGLGVVVKSLDGATRAIGPATIAVLGQLGELSEPERARLEDRRQPEVRNPGGRVVGRLDAVVRVAAATA